MSTPLLTYAIKSITKGTTYAIKKAKETLDIAQNAKAKIIHDFRNMINASIAAIKIED